MPFSSLFRRRLAFLLESLDLPHKAFAEKISSHDPHKEHITSSLVSHWLSGKRDPTPYITQISQVLRAALKHQRNFSHGELLQEVSDWYGLLALPAPEQALRAEFPAWQGPMLVGNFPLLQLPAYHVARPALVNALIYKLLAPNPENGLFHRHGVALTGWPGVGKSTLAFELIKTARPFFMGGTLYGHLRRASSQEILLQWAQALKIPSPETQTLANLALAVNTKLAQIGGRWLCVLDGVSAYEELNHLLLPQTWVLLTTQGTQALLPHGLEDWAFSLPPFTQEEALAVFQKRLGAQWEKFNDPQRVKKLYDLVEGLPMAMSILAALVHSRGWAYTLTRFQDEVRIISTIKLAPGTHPELSLQLTLELALASVPEELHFLLSAMSVFTPGRAIPGFLVEIFLTKFGEIEQKPGAWLAKLETLRESGLIEGFEGEEDPGIRYWRIHRIVALYVTGQIPTEKMACLYQQMQQLLSQHALVAQAHPCLPPLVLPALKRRQASWPHVRWVHDRIIEWFQGKRFIFEKVVCDPEILQTDALYLSRFIHALFGPEKALDYLHNLLPSVSGNPILLLSWASYKLNTHGTKGIIEELEVFLERSRKDDNISDKLRLHAYLGRAYLLQGKTEVAHLHLSRANLLLQQSSFSENPRDCFAKAEIIFAQGKEAEFHGAWEKAETFYTQAVAAFCWPALPVVLKTKPGVTLGNHQAEIAGLHYPWLVRLLESIWTLVEFREQTGLFWDAYELAREAARLALSMPWVYALDHLYLLVRLASLTGKNGLSEPILQLLERGEPFFEQPPCRSQIAATFLISDRQEAGEKLLKLAHSFRHHGWKKWTTEAQKLAEILTLTQSAFTGDHHGKYEGDFEKAVKTLALWQDQLGLPGFLSDDHPLPSQLPW